MADRPVRENADEAEVVDELVRQYADYQPTAGFDRDRFMRWLNQFKGHKRPLALRLARAVTYYGTNETLNLMRPLKQALDAHLGAGEDPLGVYYVPLGRTAESGSAIVRHFRNVNQLHNLNAQFIDLFSLVETAYASENPIFVFVDDYIGTGKQISDHWRDVLSQLVPEYLRLYVAVVAAFEQGIRRVEGETPLRVIAVHTLHSKHQMLGNGNQALSGHDKNTLRQMCGEIGNHPLGYGDIGALVSFAHGTPNNAPSVLRGGEHQRGFYGLLPGWEDL